ncbi:hypothetical protein MANES_18G057800v8 [Manihot esculenta]|uniref:Uncharacterized protein n=1 Tax=Manihot esculenta TaxID=3983 RepID=A0A2C9U0K0_MANES|nr:hypothetical protein MANES_18G057800v8 [Manihot esculenta]
MERNSSSPRKREDEGLLSCWGRLKLKLPWTKRRISSSSNSNSTSTSQRSRGGWSIASIFTRANRQPRPAGGFGYDPLSYAQNFDEGCWDDDNEDGIYRGFSSRFVPPPSRSIHEDKK